MEPAFSFNPIGIVRSCFTDKFGIPRQPGLVPAARATLEILPPYDKDEAFKALDAFSHLWLVFVFHAIPKEKWRVTVRPPRLGGNRRVGVFATRSGFRPNPIGMSAVALEGIDRHTGKLLLQLSGIDLLDNTPVLDIKPYLPYADSIPEAVGGFASERPQTSIPVVFTPQAKKRCVRLENECPGFVDLLKQVLAGDPRPAYIERQSVRRDFGMRLYDMNVRWRVQEGAIVVLTIKTHPGDGRRKHDSQKNE